MKSLQELATEKGFPYTEINVEEYNKQRKIERTKTFATLAKEYSELLKTNLSKKMRKIYQDNYNYFSNKENV